MYKSLDEKGKVCMKMTALICLIITIVILLIGGGAVLYFGYKDCINIYLIVSGILIFLELINIFIFTNIRYKRYKYLINDEKIEVIEGLFWVTRTIIPIERLHQIVLNEGPVDKKYGLVNLKIVTAGGSVKIAFIPKEEGVEITELLKNKINNIARGDTCEV